MLNVLQSYFADLHIHIGRDIQNQFVKITASKELTLTNIFIEAHERKGIQLIGIVDTQSPHVQQEIKKFMTYEGAYELQEGGIRYKDVTLLLGVEIEVYDKHCHGPIHVLCFLPTLEYMQRFTNWLKRHMKNVYLSSQRYYGSAKTLQKKVKSLEGLFIPAHVFTPFKSLYGKGVRHSLKEVFLPEFIDAIELGLSSDTKMADQIKELHDYTYISNSDAHSLGKIGREYQEILLKYPSFREFKWALQGHKGRCIKRNFGFNPRLGKYYKTVCRHCLKPLDKQVKQCSHCHRHQIVKGVYERILELKTSDTIRYDRPPYIYQVPLEFLPGLGPKTYENLLQAFQTEMNIIHQVSYEELINVTTKNIAQRIIQMRKGKLSIQAGGGGKYGKIT